MKSRLALILFTVAACSPAAEGGDDPNAPLISVHVTSEETRPGFEALEFEGQEYFVATDPTLSDDDIVVVEPEPSDDGVFLTIEVDPAGAERFGRVTSENIGRPMVVKFDDEIFGAPTVQSAIRGGRMTMKVPADSEALAADIVARVRARWPGE